MSPDSSSSAPLLGHDYVERLIEALPELGRGRQR